MGPCVPLALGDAAAAAALCAAALLLAGLLAFPFAVALVWLPLRRNHAERRHRANWSRWILEAGVDVDEHGIPEMLPAHRRLWRGRNEEDEARGAAEGALARLAPRGGGAA